MLNPDTSPRKDWLYQLHQATIRHNRHAVFGSTIVMMSDPNRVESFGDVLSVYGVAWQGGLGAHVDQLPRCDKIVLGVSGAASCYRRELFERIGGFDEAFFCYLEDVDLSLRLNRYGYNCVQVRSAIVEHFGSASSRARPDFPVFQTHRNGFRLIIKNAPILAILPVLILHISALSYLTIRNGLSGGTGARLRGLMAGLWSIPPAVRARIAARGVKRSERRTWLKLLSWNPRSLARHKIIARDEEEI